MSGGVQQFIVNIVCVAVFVAAVIGIIRLRQRVSRLPGLPSVPGKGLAGQRGGEPDGHPRVRDDASDDGDGDDGGDGGDA